MLSPAVSRGFPQGCLLVCLPPLGKFCSQTRHTPDKRRRATSAFTWRGTLPSISATHAPAGRLHGPHQTRRTDNGPSTLRKAGRLLNFHVPKSSTPLGSVPRPPPPHLSKNCRHPRQAAPHHPRSWRPCMPRRMVALPPEHVWGSEARELYIAPSRPTRASPGRR